MSFDVGSKVYFQHPEHSWVLGTITENSAGTFSCVGRIQGDSEFTARNLKIENLHNFVEGSDVIVDDLLQLPYLHDSTLLDQVRHRYFKQIMFTHIGTILLSLNPFETSIPRYQPKHMSRYFKGLTNLGDVSDIGPSLWEMAQESYELLVGGKGNQSVLVSGESGAGKTEAVKILVNYLAATSSANSASKKCDVAEKVVQTSPILEAFGNAKTLRNDNSSRFGKFMKLYFSPDESYQIVGCAIETYLLEKSRVVVHAKGERGYHAFYQFVAGRHPEMERWRLKPNGYKAALGQGGTVTFVSPQNDAEDWKEMLNAMDIVGMTKPEQVACFDILATVLHLMESVSFTEKTLANTDPCATITEPAVLLTLEFVCSNLLGINSEEFLKELTSVTHSIKGETVVKLYSKTQAMDIKDSVCKFLYDTTFQWLVQKINLVTQPDPGVYNTDTLPWIGLLDIFGFEQFPSNSLEQLCINLANEVIQSFYNQKVFVADMEECKAEGIDISSITYADNSGAVELIQGKGGIFTLLDEECSLAAGTDQTFLSKLTERKSSAVNFVRPRTEQNTFIVHHYAGGVKYNVIGFREKNSDYVKPSLTTLFRSSSHAILKTVSPDVGKSTTTKTFKTQLNSLLKTINATTPHWVRCVKPHANRRPRNFHGSEVMAQLRYSGVLDTVRIRKLGYPVRILAADFERTFRIIGGLTQVQNYKADAQMGRTKVFLRFHVYQDLLAKRAATFAKFVTIVQSFAAGKKSNFLVACKQRIPPLKLIQNTLRFRISRTQYREKEAVKMQVVWLEAAKELAKLQNEETQLRHAIGEEEALIHETIHYARKEHLDAIEIEWWRLKPSRDAVALGQLVKTESTMRESIPKEEEYEFVQILRVLRDDFDRAFEAQKKRAEMMQMALQSIQHEEDDERRQIIREELEEHKKYSRMLLQAAQRIRRSKEIEELRESERIQSYLDLVKEQNNKILALKGVECGMNRTNTYRFGRSSAMNSTNNVSGSPSQHPQPQPSSSSPSRSHYATPTFSRLAGATNPTLIMSQSPQARSPPRSGTNTRDITLSPSPPRAALRSTTPGSNQRSIGKTSVKDVTPAKADPSHTHSVSSIASLQQLQKRALRNKKLSS